MGLRGLGLEDMISWATGLGSVAVTKPQTQQDAPNAPNRLGRLGSTIKPCLEDQWDLVISKVISILFLDCKYFTYSYLITKSHDPFSIRTP